MNDRFRIPPFERLLPTLLSGLLAVVATGAFAQPEEVLTLNIERQDAGSALMELGRTSGVQIMLVEGSGAEVTVGGLYGKYRFEEALIALLKGTGLVYEFASKNTIVVRQAQESYRAEGAGREEDVEAGEAEVLVLHEQRVTGSRMKGGDPTSRIVSISAEQIARLGVSNAEELFRKVPSAFPSFTNQTTASFGIGVSYLNLRNLGTENTLVLINGRRVSAIGGDSGGRVNLLNIPLSAIERIDIDLGSASAVYGSDAIGGVANFITKKRHSGLEATVREEYSATDADRRTLSLSGGYTWDTGSMIAMVSHDRSKPVNNRKIWTSNDFRDQYGPEYDKRDQNIGQPGVVCPVFEWPHQYYDPTCDWWKPYLQLRPGHSGVGATVDDFTTDITPTDYVPPYNGADSTVLAFNARAEQLMGENLTLYGEVLYSDVEASREVPTRLLKYYIPANNAYNPFGRDVLVNYLPERVIESGLFPPATTETQFKHPSYTVGVLWTFGGGHEVDVGITHSRPKASGTNSSYPWDRRNDGDPTAEEFYRALESSDPSVALNPFGNGTVQGSAFGSFLHADSRRQGSSAFTSAEVLVRGDQFEIWGGPIDYVVGGEYRVQKVERTQSVSGRGFGESVSDYADIVGDPEPTVVLVAAFLELGSRSLGNKTRARAFAGFI